MNVRSFSKRAIALLLSLVLLTGMLPVGALATETEPTVTATTEATEPSTEATEPSTEATEPSTEATEPSTEATEPSTEATEPEVIAVTGITLDQTALEVGVGELPITLTATVLPEDAADKTVTWTSSEPGVVSVENGVLTFGYMGEATITATAGEFSATCTVKVGEGAWGTYDENTTYVLAGGDFQPLSNDVDAGKTLLAGILDTIEDKYAHMDGFLFLGDYSYSGSDSSSTTNVNYATNGLNAVKETVLASYSTLGTNTNDMIWVQGNHDYNIDALSPSGANDTDAYGVYVIHEDDFPGDNSNAESTVQATATALDAYLDAKAEDSYDKPIFVVSHLPLHFTYRTVSRYDGIYADKLVDVLNEAGNKGLNIFFLYGHIHSHGYDEYMGGEYVYIPRNGQIAVATSQTSCEYETIDFTYLNGGYVSYYCDTPGNSSGYDTDDALSMTVFEITDNDVTIHRYNNDGEVNLKNAGAFTSKDSTSYGYSINSTVVGSPQTVDLQQFVPTVTITKSDVTVSAPGITDLTVSTVDTPAAVSDLLEPGAVAYDIEVANFTGGTASVTLPIPADMDASRFAVYYVPTEGAPEKMTGSASADGSSYTFTTTHFSTYVGGVAPAAEAGETVAVDSNGWVTITAPTEAGTRYVYELDTDGVDTNVEYLIVANSYPKALSAAASSNNAVDITINGNYAYADSDTYGWTFTPQYSYYDNGVYYIRLNGSTYLQANNKGTLASNTSTGSTRRWTVSSNNDGSYDIVRGDYNLRWSNSKGVFQASSSNEGPVRLYKYQKTETTEAGPGLYGQLVGNLNYTVTSDTPESSALAAVKAGITVAYGSDNTAATGMVFADDGEGMSWSIADYNANVPGNYTVTITYNGVKLGTATVTVADKTAQSISVSPKTITVERDTPASTVVGTITVDYGDTTEKVDLTLEMLSGNLNLFKNGTYSGLSVTYANQTDSGITVNVVNKTGVNDFPTYPNPGSVDVEKSAKGENFQNTGLARVELSTSGLPSEKGVDVLVVLDTSSSMKNDRITALQQALKDMLLAFNKMDGQGRVADIQIAIMDFNGYENSAQGYPHVVGSELTNTGNYWERDDAAKVYTGTYKNQNTAEAWSNGAAAFVQNTTFVNADGTLNTGVFDPTDVTVSSGTAYDLGLIRAYNMMAAKQAQNRAQGVERDSYVIFMSDGAPYGYNGIMTKTDYGIWNDYLMGTYPSLQAMEDAVKASITAAGGNPDSMEFNALTYNFAYLYNGKGTGTGVNTDASGAALHPHRWAEAIKGNPGQSYTVFDGNLSATTATGLGATMFTIGFQLADDNSGDGTYVATTGRAGTTYKATMEAVLKVIASYDETKSNTRHYYSAEDATTLSAAFTDIADNIRFAATNAVFHDQMGSAFDLQMNPTVKSNATTAVDGTTTVDTSITVTSQSVYTAADAEEGNCNADDVGKTYGSVITLEKVTFTADANGNIIATSSAKTEDDGNILNKGVIEANTFFYNTTSDIKTITLKNGSTYQLPGETFYWDIGTINEKQYTLSYMVYLTGAMEGKALPADSYETNNYARLTYTNHVGNEVSQSVPSPAMPWGGANVSYAFYLVDAEGNPLLQNGTKAENFLTSYKVTQPVLYRTINLNAGETVLSAIGKDVLPYGYELYDDTAAYTVTVLSGDGNSNWNITYDATKVQSTYVMGYKAAQDYSNAQTENNTSYDYTHTTVYFAVKWNIGTVPDAVVIDYGLPVNISVLENDMFGGNGTLVGVGMAANKPDTYTTALDVNFANSINKENGTDYGTAIVNGDKVNYVLDSMTMDKPEYLAYAVNYTGNTNPGYYYGEVTVIPATTIYFEDTFLSLESYSKSGDTWTQDDPTKWTQAASSGTQAEDRPGEFSLPNVDANNIYGYDGAYKTMATHSLGNAASVHVDANSYATATFTFAGTGFDVISMTSNTTGTLVVRVYDSDGNCVKNTVVDTYYGMEEDGTVSANNRSAIYQVPVIKIFDLHYAKYDVTITATYGEFFDHTATENEDGTKDGYDLYLDAIRIYDPTGNEDKTANDAYVQDGEAYPVYEELRDKIISASEYEVTEDEDGTVTVSGNDLSGAIFIDCNDAVKSIADYVSYGPNNEVYLANSQAIAFKVDVTETMADVQLGIKVANGGAVTYKINGVSYTVESTTDMYYSIWEYVKDAAGVAQVVTIENVSGGILSLTNIKATFTAQTITNGLLRMTAGDAGVALMSLRAAPVEEEEVPETTAPEEPSEPEEDVPETTVPEETTPETTEPEETVPEVTEPDEDSSEEATVEDVVETVRKIVKKLFGWLFG